jgi:hypothetical protein
MCCVFWVIVLIEFCVWKQWQTLVVECLHVSYLVSNALILPRYAAAAVLFFTLFKLYSDFFNWGYFIVSYNCVSLIFWLVRLLLWCFMFIFMWSEGMLNWFMNNPLVCEDITKWWFFHCLMLIDPTIRTVMQLISYAGSWIKLYFMFVCSISSM